MNIRDEGTGEERAIARLIEVAFREAPHSDGSEHALPGRLREGGHLAMSLVAEEDEALVGQVPCSPVTISDGSTGWYGLAPVSVASTRQGEGIDMALIREGLSRLSQMGANGFVVLGEPGYYNRFGFAHDPVLAFPGALAEFFMRVELGGPAPSGTVTYAPAFY